MSSWVAQTCAPFVRLVEQIVGDVDDRRCGTKIMPYRVAQVQTHAWAKCPGRQSIHSGGTSSAQTRNPDKVAGPKVWVRGTSAASRPCAMRTRPIRGAL